MSRSILKNPLVFEITRVDCISIVFLTDQSQRKMLKEIGNVLENTTDPEIREAVKKKLEDKREIVAATHDINQVSKHLDGLEELFDELEAQLTRKKQSLY